MPKLKITFDVFFKSETTRQNSFAHRIFQFTPNSALYDVPINHSHFQPELSITTRLPALLWMASISALQTVTMMEDSAANEIFVELSSCCTECFDYTLNLNLNLNSTQLNQIEASFSLAISLLFGQREIAMSCPQKANALIKLTRGVACAYLLKH